MVHYTIQNYGDTWLDNGIVSLNSILQRCDGLGDLMLAHDGITFDINDFDIFLKSLNSIILLSVNDLLYFEEQDEKTKEIVRKRRQYVLFQQVKGGDPKEKLFNKETSKVLLESFFKNNKGTKTCNFCGKDEIQTFKMKQSIYPFVTKIRSLGGIRGQTEYIDVCGICYLIAASTWLDDGNIYTNFNPSSKGFSIFILPIQGDLEKLHKTKQIMRAIARNDFKMSSLVRNVVFNNKQKSITGIKQYSTLLLLFEEIMDKIRDVPEDMFSVTLGQTLCKEWESLNIPHGSVKNIKIEYMNVTEQSLRIVYRLTERKIRFYSDIIKRVFFIKDDKIDWNYSNEIQESLCKAFLENDFYHFASRLLPHRGGKCSMSIESIDIILIEWRLPIMEITEINLDMIKKVGNIVAEVSIRNSGLLYRLDKTRNFSEFLEGLSSISRAMIRLISEKSVKESLTFTPTSFDDLLKMLTSKKEIWKDFKYILLIYSSMYYTVKQLKRGKKK